MSSYNNNNISPQFVKVFIPNLSSKSLLIPPAFKDRVSGDLPRRIFLRNGVGKPWLVEVNKIGNNFYFQGGWSKFVLENSLRFGEFIVFKYTGQKFFDVVILGMNGCDKELGTSSSQKKLDEGDDDDDDDGDGHDDDNDDDKKDEVMVMDNMKFGKVLHNQNSSEFTAKEGEQYEGITMYIPKKNPYFITRLKRSELEHNRILIPKSASNIKISDSIVLQDPTGRNWDAKKSIWKNGQICILGGWRYLCNANKVREDDIIICEFLPQSNRTCDTVMKFQIIGSNTVKGNFICQ